MKTADFLEQFKYARKAVRIVAKATMFSNMVAQNIADMFDSKWEITPTGYGVKVRPAKDVVITPDVFDKLCGKLAKAFNKEPSKQVYPETITADFWVYPTAYSRSEWGQSVNIEISVGNTEKCDFVVKRKMQKISEPTGYCLALKEKKYLTANAN